MADNLDRLMSLLNPPAPTSQEAASSITSSVISLISSHQTLLNQKFFLCEVEEEGEEKKNRDLMIQQLGDATSKKCVFFPCISVIHRAFRYESSNERSNNMCMPHLTTGAEPNQQEFMVCL